MKTKYIAPKSQVFSLETEQIIAASGKINIEINDKDDFDAADSYSYKRYPWDTETWED